MDMRNVFYIRVADSFFSGLEAIGGFYESIHIIGHMAVIFFVKRLFMSSFLRSLYQVDAEHVPPTVKVPDINHMIKEVDTEGKVSDDYLKQILTIFLLRIRFQYGYKEIIYYLFNCMCLRPKKKINETISERR